MTLNIVRNYVYDFGTVDLGYTEMKGTKELESS